ncbi:hypothetical protein [Kineosporia sp. A_224]|uniref:hypothetical protein n=1 Tax=Kineosporia sp. A_224 TaxID=1962180 RepID=UPI00117AA5B5|nr:hypothetical protein [Kineosporia sp. A_224]
MRRVQIAWVSGLAVSLALAVLSFAVIHRGNDTRDLPPVVYADGATLYPSDTLEDLVRHADAVLLVTAVTAKEETDPAPPARVAAGELWIYRVISFEVAETLWRRPDAAAPPLQFDAVWAGWVTHNGKRSKLVVDGSTWVEIGQNYLMPVTRDSTGRIVPDMPYAVFPVSSGIVTPAERQDTELAKLWAGRSVEAASADIEAAEPKVAVVGGGTN